MLATPVFGGFFYPSHKNRSGARKPQPHPTGELFQKVDYKLVFQPRTPV